MRIAQITYSYKPIIGGADVWAQLLRDVCDEAGHETTVFQRPCDGVEDPAVRMICSPLSRFIGRRGEFWTLPYGLRTMRDELARQDVLVVHYPNYHRQLEWHPATVLISHGVFWDDKPGALRSRIKRSLARRAYMKAAAVVANDTFFLREVGEDIQPGAEPFSEVAPGRFFVPNCVDTDKFTRIEPHPDLPQGPMVIVPRNVYRNRGVHLAIEAFALCEGEIAGATLLIAGADGQASYAAHCRKMAEDLRGHREVRFFGPIPWDRMPEAYSASELTVIPTICGEGTSLSALESMSCGTATVTTDVAGLADLPAMKASPTPEALAQSMQAAWEQRDELGAAQQQTVRTVYNMANWKSAWSKILTRFEHVSQTG